MALAPAPLTPPVIDGVPAQHLSVTASATLLGLSHMTIRRAIWDGELPARRVGGKIIIAISDLDTWAAPIPPRVHVDDLNAFGTPNGEWVVSVQPARSDFPCEDNGLARHMPHGAA